MENIYSSMVIVIGVLTIFMWSKPGDVRKSFINKLGQHKKIVLWCVLGALAVLMVFNSGYHLSEEEAAISYAGLEKEASLLMTLPLDSENLYVYYNPEADNYCTVRVMNIGSIYYAGVGLVYENYHDDVIRTLGGMKIAGPNQASLSYYVINESSMIEHIGLEGPEGLVGVVLAQANGGTILSYMVPDSYMAGDYRLVGLGRDGNVVAYYGDKDSLDGEAQWVFVGTDE